MPEAVGGEQAMPGSGAYLLQQQQQRNGQSSRRPPNGKRRGNQTSKQGSESVPPPQENGHQKAETITQSIPTHENGGVGGDSESKASGSRKPRNPRHRKKPSGGVSVATNAESLSRISSTTGEPTMNSSDISAAKNINVSARGSQANLSGYEQTTVNGTSRNRKFNGNLSTSGNSKSAIDPARLDPSANTFVPGGGKSQRQQNSRHTNQHDATSNHTRASLNQVHKQRQTSTSHQMSSGSTPLSTNQAARRNPRTRKVFQGKLTEDSNNKTSSEVDFQDMQERAALGLATVEKRYHGWDAMKADEDGLVSKLVRGLGGVGGEWSECVIVSGEGG